MNISVGPEDVQMPRRWNSDTYSRDRICEACGEELPYGNEHTLLECLKHITSRLDELTRKP